MALRRRSSPLSLFLSRFNFTRSQFQQTELVWGMLMDIRAHHIAQHASLRSAAEGVSSTLQGIEQVHSLKLRVKDPDHLIAKIIRKKLERPELEVDVDNYTQSITDLAGIRALHLFKDDWRYIHNAVVAEWDLHEEPVAYIRTGDDGGSAIQALGCSVREHKFGYRSVHYLVKTNLGKVTRLVEVQVRTLFEEGWSEIDHRLRYPRQSNDPQIAFLLQIFNRLAGGADELGTFAKNLDEHLRGVRKEKRELEMQISDLKISSAQKRELKERIDQVSAFPSVTNFPSLFGVGAPQAAVRTEMLRQSILPLLGTCSKCGAEIRRLAGLAAIGTLCDSCMLNPNPM